MHQIRLKDLNEYNLFTGKENNLILRALMLSLNEIEIDLKNTLPKYPLIRLFNSNDVQLTDITIVSFEKEKKISIKGQYKTNENYKVIIGNDIENVILNPLPGGILDTLYYCNDDNFGVTVFNNSVYFKVWSPPAIRIELLLFDKEEKIVNTSVPILLGVTKPGVWEISIKPEDFNLTSLDGYFYQYLVTAYGSQRIALDPYAISMASFNSASNDKIGKGAIIDIKSPKANPPDFKKNYSNDKFIENNCDIIAYEINVRDFTIMPGIVEDEIAGSYKGFIQKSEYIKDLGITHVQLMPVSNAYTQNEQNRAFTNKKSEQSHYNWGYDPMNYFTLEGRYSTNPSNPYARIYEFKALIQNLHDSGIGVILDVVFNHTFIADTFENIAPGCYYRLTKDYKISGHTGAGSTIESRLKQVRKLILDVLLFFIREYQIDGFRFDLMSFMDKETIRLIREKAGYAYNPENPEELILQGEAWNFTDLENDAFVKTDYESLNIGIFNDTFRDSVSGNGHFYGYIQGNNGEAGRVASGIVGGVKSYDNNVLPFDKNIFFSPYNLFAQEPSDCLNYLSVHDGLTLWDKIKLSLNDSNKNERLTLMKFAYAILFTSQGKIILHGGDEILRTKPLSDYDTEKHRAFTSEKIEEEEYTKFFHENSYCSNDFTNMFRWNRLNDEFSDLSIELLEYLKGLIKMRRYYSAFRLNTAHKINTSLKFLNDTEVIKEKVNSFNSYKLQQFSVCFINGKPDETYYLTGEIHKTNPNPLHNPYKIVFDKNGSAKITFNKAEIENFDLQKWENPRNLNIKLVKTPGNWDYPEYAYTNYGDNAICPENLNENNEIVIDLSKIDFKSFSNHIEKQTEYIAYVIENNDSITTSISAKRFLIIHNPLNSVITINFNTINLRNAYIIADNKNAGICKLTQSQVIIEDNCVKVPEKSSTVIVCIE